MKNLPIKNDAGKLRFDLIAPDVVSSIAEVLTMGAKKYDAHNWRRGNGLEYSRIIAAVFRHLYAWEGGERIDKESGLNHLAHAMTDLMFLLHYEDTGTGIDDIDWGKK